MLFPIVRVSNFPVPIILIFGFVLLRGKLPIPKLFFYACIVAGMFILIVTILNIVITNNLSLENYSLKDLHYFCIPIAYGISTGIIVTLFGGSRGKQTLLRFLSFFLTIQFVFMILQHLNPYNFRDLTEPYLLMLAKYVSSGQTQVASIGFRPAGFAINATWAGYLFYPMGRLLYTYTNKSRYLAISAGILMLGGARMAILIFVVSELALFCLDWASCLVRLRLNRYQVKRFLVAMILVGFFSIITFFAAPKTFQDQFKSVIANGLKPLKETYNYTYRMSMYKILWDHPENWALGGWVLRDFSARGIMYVDSEVVMRSLQLGIIGFLSFHLPLYGMLLYSHRHGYRLMLKVMIVLVILACFSSLTSLIITNPRFIGVISVLIGFCILDAKERLASIQKDTSECPRTKKRRCY